MFLKTSLRLSLSALFLLSAVGKLIAPQTTALSLVQFVPVSLPVARALVFLLAALELLLAGLIWWRVHLLLLAVPGLLWAAFLLSTLKGVACGCFGNLPLLSTLSAPQHVLLLTGVFLAFAYLAESQSETGPEEPVPSAASKGERLLGTLALLTLLLGLVPLPRSVAGNPGGTTLRQVNRAFVAAARTAPNVALLDARPAFQFQLGHIPGAINLPYNAEGLSGILESHGLRDKVVVVYCASARCEVAERLAQRLLAAGCRDVRLYPGGWAEWSQLHPE